ncbi:hypothetical protein GQF01_13130 [Paenibacillus sp. 5J-6]|uniref:Uncharacterized protein n=1 Tax=Paenibacillus silvestris TaxID=2606219 RepID=A0A6L8V1E4_9BACL|nr:hypothetical protein [Paenibacillus silvestris]MZQ83050.1 hypothetical protein [Paenibacillus silvestris]
MFVSIVVVLSLFALAVAGITVTAARRQNKVVIVSIEVIVSVGLPILLFNLYEKWFPDYYSHGFFPNLGALLAAAVMLTVNLVLLSPLLNRLFEKYVDDLRRIIFVVIIPMIMVSAFGQLIIMHMLNE